MSSTCGARVLCRQRAKPSQHQEVRIFFTHGLKRTANTLTNPANTIRVSLLLYVSSSEILARPPRVVFHSTVAAAQRCSRRVHKAKIRASDTRKRSKYWNSSGGTPGSLFTGALCCYCGLCNRWGTLCSAASASCQHWPAHRGRLTLANPYPSNIHSARCCRRTVVRVQV